MMPWYPAPESDDEREERLRPEPTPPAQAPAAPSVGEPVADLEFDDYPDFHDEAMGCGLEDRGIRDRYEAMRYGWDQAMERVGERIDGFLENLATPPAAPAATEAPSAEQIITTASHQGMWGLRDEAGNLTVDGRRLIGVVRALVTPAPAVGASVQTVFDGESDAQTLLRKYKKLCMEIKRGDGYHLARIDKAIAALAAATPKESA